LWGDARKGRALEKQTGVRFVRADVANEADVKAMIDRTLEWFGRLDCFVNNAGIPSPMVSITEIDVATIDQVLAVNVKGVLLGIKHAAPAMLAQQSGSIVNISSMAGLRGGVSGHIYSASKGAVSALTRSVAAELGENGIRVNSISPGAVVTGIFGKNAGLEGSKADQVAGVVKEAFAKIQPIPRAGMPEDIAQAAVFLASDGSGFINGQDIVIDGDIRPSRGDGRSRWPLAAKCRSGSRRQLPRFRPVATAQETGCACPPHPPHEAA
jgi:NAD(P)-dependent dehydrogenase (short-subunit alcohol dehydrogenase family)